MTIPVAWITLDGGNARCCWDQEIVDWLVAQTVPGSHDLEHRPIEPGDTGAVVAVPARYNADRIDKLNELIAPLAWVVVILTSDEESTFQWRLVEHPNMRIWVQAPRPDKHNDPNLRFIPHGWQPDTIEHLAVLATPERPAAWFFAGQVNHGQRDDCLAAMAKVAGGEVHPSPGFTQGLGRAAYLDGLATAKVAPSPAGPASADSFRTWEALQAGAVPIVDQGPAPDEEGRAIDGYPAGFWDLVCDGRPPFPVVDTWDDAPVAAEQLLAAWPASANRVQAWWLRHRRNLAARLHADISDLSGLVRADRLSDQVTVLIPTSPIPSHPSTEVIDETVATVRSQPSLADVEIIVMVDGIRPEQEQRRADYEEYTRRLLWHAAHRWGPCIPLLFDSHHHQAAMTRRALDEVRTPLIMFVEHDTPLVGPVCWDRIGKVLLSGHLDLIRLYHEARIPEPHRILMRPTTEIGGVPYMATKQWSQRPHVARADWYRDLLEQHFTPDERWMIEDRMHSVVAVAHDQLGFDRAWDRFRIAVYTPGAEGTWKRSEHLDGRAGDTKWVDR